VARKVLVFALIGGSNTILDFIIFNIIAHGLHLTLFGIPEVAVAQFISASILVPLSYVLNRRFTFQSDKSLKSTFIQFISVSLFNGWVLQTATILVVVKVLGSTGIGLIGDEILLNNFAKCCGIGLGMVSNFTFYHFIFRSPAEADLAAGSPDDSARADSAADSARSE
jgi:putative flippase GtrA